MNDMTRIFKVAGVVILPLFFCACLSVQIIGHVDNPDRYFSKAYLQVEKLHQKYPHREGRAHRLYVLVHENSEGKLIQVSVPIWLVNACLHWGLKAAESEHEFREIKRRYDLDWRAIRDIGQFGPGLLVEVNDEDTKILVWLK